MQFVRRIVRADLDLIADIAFVVFGVAVTALSMWGPSNLLRTGFPGPVTLRAVLPLLMGAALALRRRAPLAMWIGMWAILALQHAITGFSLHTWGWLLVPFAGAYSLGAHARMRSSLIGVAMSLALVLASGFQPASLAILVFWFIGVFVRARRQSAALAARNAELQRQAGQAAAAERARIARELHDIVAHHLSVIVLQAAGARASGFSADATLEKIERTGRQALAETRRLLDVLRDPAEDASLAPQPGLGELGALVASVDTAGLPVTLTIRGDISRVPAAVDVSAFRIVQEALTNVVKHAGPARAHITVDCRHDEVTIDVTDTGTPRPASPDLTGGHGLSGMRERVTALGGDLRAGPSDRGGFGVHARLPLQAQQPRGTEPS